jgi:hypothetical protein
MEGIRGIIRYLIRSISVLNLSILACALLVVWHGLLPLLHVSFVYKPRQAKEATAATAEAQGLIKAPPLSDFLVIADQNLFNKERKMPSDKTAEKALPRPEIVLYGTLRMENMLVAFIEDKRSPKTTPSRGKQQAVVRQGDMIGGFIVKQIGPDRIVLSRGEDLMTVYLDDEQKRSGTPKTPVRPAPQ